MKKLLFSISLMMLMASNVSAQLKVNSNGKVTIASSENLIPAKLVVGNDPTSSVMKGLSTDIGISSTSVATDLLRNSYGIIGRAKASNVLSPNLNQCITIGVMGMADNTFTGYGYGVSGILANSSKGAAIYGSSNDNGIRISGRYAGYFDGETFVDGAMMAKDFVTPSDARLKANIESVSAEDNVLEKIQYMNVVSYNYNNRNSQESINLLTGETSGDANTMAIAERGDDSRKHYGLLAQELQRIYPELVHEGQDGYLGINYVELVPILIRSIQELKAELDEVKGNSSRMEARRVSLEDETTTNILSSTVHGNILYQNTPNPFKEQTTIRFKLAENVQNASICIFDMAGKMLKKVPVSSEMENVSIGGYELGEGMFLYSLIVNGQAIDTKRMVISK